MWKQPLVLLLICFVVMATRELKDEAKKTFSPPQCKKQCQQSNCVSYVLVKSGLACHVTEENKESEEEEDQSMNGQPAQYTKIIKSGSKYIRCGKPSLETFNQCHDTGPRLLFVTLDSKRSIFRDVYVNNKEVKPYPYLNITYVTAIAHMSERRRILLATREKKIISAPLDTCSGQKTLKRNIWSVAIAVDEQNQFVFLGMKRPRFSLHRMTTDGRDFHLVVQVPRSVRSISPDPKHNRVFICTYFRIFYTFYDDNILRVLTDTMVYAVSLDPDNNALYYNDNTSIVKRSLSTGNKTVLMSLPEEFYYMIYHRGMMYISCGNKIIICVVDNNNCTELKIHEFKILWTFCLLH